MRTVPVPVLIIDADMGMDKRKAEYIRLEKQVFGMQSAMDTKMSSCMTAMKIAQSMAPVVAPLGNQADHLEQAVATFKRVHHAFTAALRCQKMEGDNYPGCWPPSPAADPAGSQGHRRRPITAQIMTLANETSEVTEVTKVTEASKALTGGSKDPGGISWSPEAKRIQHEAFQTDPGASEAVLAWCKASAQPCPLCRQMGKPDTRHTYTKRFRYPDSLESPSIRLRPAPSSCSLAQ